MTTIIFNNNCERNGEITARISQLFNQVRTDIMALMLVAKREVSTQVSTEKVKCSSRLIMGVISIKNSIISMIVGRLDLYLNYIKRQGLTQAVQKVKSFFLVRCHQNSDKDTERGSGNLYRISKSFTKTVKVNIEFCTSIKRFLLLVSTQVSTEKALFLIVRTQVRTRKALFELVAINEVAKLISIQNELYKWKPINKSLMLNREVRSKCEPKTGVLLRTSRIFRHVRKALAELANYLPFLLIFSRQVVITQAEKLVFSFFACSSICSIKSWGKRMFLSLELLLLRPVAIFKPFNLYYLYLHYTANNINKKDLTCKYTLNYIVGTPINLVGFKNNDNSRYWHTTSYLTQPLNGVMIMANRYDSAYLCARQSKVYKFYDLSTAQVVQTIATTERQARKNLGKQSLIFIARKQINSVFERSTSWGGFSHA